MPKHAQHFAPHYGPRKVFKTSAGNFIADSRDEAAAKARAKTGTDPSFIEGPRITDALRAKPKGNRAHADVEYLGIRAEVRRMNRARA